MLINIACGDEYIPEWNNFDYFPHSKFVRKTNLLEGLPIKDGLADVVYSSHFLEHIPRHAVSSFIAECSRVLRSGGRLRLVLPDMEELCRTYLFYREKGKNEMANFLMLEMFDQCVRTTPGGELGAYYKCLTSDRAMYHQYETFVQDRTGHLINSEISSCNSIIKINVIQKIVLRLEKIYCNAVIGLLPKAFRMQNVSRTPIGEKHHWIYDYYTVRQLLISAGFIKVERCTANTSSIDNFPYYPLDVRKNGSPRKGCESMYIEADKP